MNPFRESAQEEVLKQDAKEALESRIKAEDLPHSRDIMDERCPRCRESRCVFTYVADGCINVRGDHFHAVCGCCRMNSEWGLRK